MSDYISPLTVPTRTHHAEHNGCQVITATAMPEPVLNALVALVDALGAAFAARDEADREADANLVRRRCPRHVGQYADHCGPCRSEQIGADDETPSEPLDPSYVGVGALAQARAEVVRKKRAREEREAAS